ncbi:MAG: anaerobic ribonucleoside triphosphate reductase [candidate division CPR1 bacterium ADurb.Bin160]|uniref:Anaerobic ribonucleoside triphosphate reductase n=1 Tax=candidate division CPR1 bacterium ADurb.Bin160 TaxID=1852826 RepID=A0A1V5ZLK9_9BACT|nr:MAG: anaerobic ribonucleoside triphosphate reductase [candidate division CPR1 bacterium ADurb.Bin160]
MLSVGFDYDQEFIDIYNRFNTSSSGKTFLDVFGISRRKLDIATMSKLYFSNTENDRSVDVNANIGKQLSNNNYSAEITKGLSKLNSLYLLWNELQKIYGKEHAKKCIDGIISGDYYFHDMISVQIPYCFSFSSRNVMVDGRKYGQLRSKPCKRSESFIAVCVESIFDMAQEQMGALAIPDFIVNLSYFYHKEGINPDDEKDKYKIINDFQRVVHCLNQQYRLSSQSAFTNFSLFDRSIFKKTFEEYRFPDGSLATDISEYFQKIQRIFMDFMSKKDPSTNLPYRFPISTVNIYVTNENEVEDKIFLEDVCKYNSEGVFNIFICRGLAKLASCCRLLSDPLKLQEFSRFDSFGNGGLSLGSARVVTINFARIGKLSKNSESKYFEILEEKMEDVRKLLKSQRQIMKKRIEQGFLKFFTLNWMNMNMFFSTFGMNGIYESLKFMGKDIRDNDGTEMAIKIFKFVEKKLDEFSKEDMIAYNFEQVPAEGSASTLAKLDATYFNDENYPYRIYGNQFLPLWIKADVVERAKLDGILSHHMTGGSICHLNIGAKTTEKQMNDLIELAIKSGLEHFALNPNFSICEDNHTTLGNSNTKICPICSKSIVNNYSRVVGYFTNVTDWDKIRREDDFPNRVFNYL